MSPIKFILDQTGAEKKEIVKSETDASVGRVDVKITPTSLH